MRLGEIIKLMRQQWPFDGKAKLVLNGYRVLGLNHQLTLADIALRNHLFAAAPPARDLYEAGIIEGRRRCALELFTLARTDVAALYALIETKPSPQGN